MDKTWGTAVLVLLFALRCLVPLALTLAVGYLMNRLVDRWEAEEEATKQKAWQPCATYSLHGLQCWVVRMTQEGALPTECVNCPIYKQALRPT